MNAPLRYAPRQLEIVAPLSGILFPLEIVPDPVFAQKMVGDGVSLDPLSGEVLAPVDGRITQMHPAHHAVTVTTEEGVEVMVHVGVDTVLLKGEGFEPLASVGQFVRRGEALLRFDVGLLALKAPSCLTQIIVTNGERVANMRAAQGEVAAGKDVVLTVDLVGDSQLGATDFQSSAGFANASTEELADGPLDSVYSDWIALPNPVGLHARPAAILAAEAKKFDAEVRMIRGNDEVNVRSIVAVLGLETHHGEQVCLKATGRQAGGAVVALAALLREGCGELDTNSSENDAPYSTSDSAHQPGSDVPALDTTATVSTTSDELCGVGASPGVAIGRVFRLETQAFAIEETGASMDEEMHRLQRALKAAREELCALIPGAQPASDGGVAKERPAHHAILQAHMELLDDPDLVDGANDAIRRGRSAAFAWQASFMAQAQRLAQLHSPLLRERAADIRDVGRRVLARLAEAVSPVAAIPDGSILIAEELSPSDTVALDRTKVAGFCTTTGGATSHVAILARSLGIPAVCGIDSAVWGLENGAQVVLDGQRGTLLSRPTESDLAAARRRIAQLVERDREDQFAAQQPAVTLDGLRIEVVANVRNADDARAALQVGAEGVGLLRSEFLFDERDTAPSETEQAQAYCAVARALGPDRPLVIRTLDVGGDKPLSYLPLPAEDNPFLGLRGLRVSLARPELFRTQLRAILQAAHLGKVHIMFPMVTSLEELREAKAVLSEEMSSMSIPSEAVKVGMMVEVPSAAVMADAFAPEVDFFSIGTNDLTQYALAMDRGHPQLAKSADALHPAVLRLIGLTTKGAHKHGKWVGVCGGIAGDPLAVPVLIGLGVDELSATVPAIAAVKAHIQKLYVAECKELAHEVLALATTAEVRARLGAYARKFEGI